MSFPLSSQINDLILPVTDLGAPHGALMTFCEVINMMVLNTFAQNSRFIYALEEYCKC